MDPAVPEKGRRADIVRFCSAGDDGAESARFSPPGDQDKKWTRSGAGLEGLDPGVLSLDPSLPTTVKSTQGSQSVAASL